MITHCDLICVSLITNEVNYPLKKNRSLYFHFCEIFLLFIFLLSSFFFFGGLALHCYAGAFSLCCVCRLLMAMASLVAEHRILA